MQKQNPKGKFIVIEGTDGSGKTTQTEALLRRLRNEGVDCETIRFPQYEKNIFGSLIRECLDGKRGDFIKLDPKIASVLYACDRFETKDKIQGWLDSGKTVVADRYVSSNQIHQGGKIKDEKSRIEFLNWLSAMEYDTLGVIRPDAVFYLDMPADISMKLITDRGGADNADIDFEYLKNSKEAGKYMVAREKFWVSIECAPDDVLLSIEKISEVLWEKVRDVVYFS